MVLDVRREERRDPAFFFVFLRACFGGRRGGALAPKKKHWFREGGQGPRETPPRRGRRRHLDVGEGGLGGRGTYGIPPSLRRQARKILILKVKIMKMNKEHFEN